MAEQSGEQEDRASARGSLGDAGRLLVQASVDAGLVVVVLNAARLNSFTPPQLAGEARPAGGRAAAAREAARTGA